MDWQVVGRVAARVGHRASDGKRKLTDRIHGDRPAWVVGYRGYGTPELVHVRGRVLLGEPLAPATADDRWWINLANAYRRLDTHEVAGARVHVQFEEASAHATADDEGYFRADLRPPRPSPRSAFWREARVELVDPPGRGTTVPVAIPGAPRFGVISDLDDTVLKTDVRSIVRMGREVLFGNAHTRIPFPGVGAFYRALHAGVNPLFYVSSSPWNLYDLLSQFLNLHRIPVGPMDLRVWDLTGARGLPTRGHHGHKREAIDRILASYPDLGFILVGDSGQQDPEIYRGVVHDHPNRVLAIYIRSVVPEPGRIGAIEALGRELAEHDIDLLLAHDTLEAARHAAERGWVPPEATEDVARDRAREEAAAG